jgi:hypothetical protein
MTRTRRALLAALAASSLTAANLEAVVPPNSPLKSFRHANLTIPTQYLSLERVPAESAARVATDLASLGIGADSAFYDARMGRLSSLILSEPLVPGTGDGNTLKWVNLGGRPADDGAMRDAVWSAVVRYLQDHQPVLRVDVTELQAPRINILEQGNIIQVYSQRVLNGIPVRDSSVSAFINHGNLVLLGLQNWGDDAALAGAPLVAADDARLVVSQHAQPFFITSYSKDTHLEYIPMVRGDGYDFRLAWVLRTTVQGDLGTWEGLVDAVSGELLAFEDKNQYVARKAIGGVYPVSNDQRPVDGVEQPGYPMPFLNVTTPAGALTTNSAGAIGCVTGTISSALVGRYTLMADVCGAANETSAAGDLDLSFGPTAAATDCTVPVGHSAGDTKSSRTGLYELTRINEQARGFLPANTWLNGTLTANMNINNTCNAFWSGTVNFYRDNGSACRNTGEIAAIFDHEWGHGLDNNGANPTISNPGESIADIHATLRLSNSCVGRGFFKNQVCGGYGDPCTGTPATGCTGVRDADFANHISGAPHGITWIRANCGAGGGGPCGGEVHCEGQPVSEVGWDVQFRDLRAAPFNFDAHTALELTTRMFYLGAETVTNWYTCSAGCETTGTCGCGATGGYLLMLGADDDNGNLTDGTPHMQAINAAFARHQMACNTPAVANSGCAGGPTARPVMTAVAQDQGAALSWGAVANASRYYVYQTEGANGADFGKIKIGETTGTTFVTTSLQNGRPYFFSVLPVGSNTSCFGLMSTPLAVTPVAGANLGVRPGSTVTVTGGDGDTFLDNCETGNVTFTVDNTGTGTLTNVRLVAVSFITHPTSVLQTTLPATIAASLTDCASANGAFSFILQGATFNQTSQIRIDVTADQLPPGQVRSQVISIGPVEMDAVPVATRTYNFDTDMSGWTVTSGTFNRTAGGANGTPFYLSSSENLQFQCDVVRSPSIRLSATSTLSLQNNYQIEPTDPVGGPYDRANVGVVDAALGTRTVVIPSSGSPYTLTNTPTPLYAECQLGGQAGWNATSPGYPNFAASNWNAAALNPGGVFNGRVTNLEIRYGTDFGLHLEGFDFDEVVLTNFEDLIPDVFPNTCIAQAVAPFGLAVDTVGNAVMEPNETATMSPTWRNTGTNAITLTGATSGFTGPAGGVYTNPDNAASYGTIGVAAQGTCTTDCYSVLATATPRPLTHWDSTILETVTPTATTKTWTLHIGNSFTDVPTSNAFYRFVETILHKNVTGGCSGTTYCPSNSTTREQMAVFVLVSKGAPVPPACVAGSEVFTDVPASSPFCKWIEELARLGVVTGCGGGNYCPSDPVTREQMAVFVLRTLDGTLNPPNCVPPNLFADVPETSPFCKWIEELANRGVVTGCGGGNYCPTADVTREQMSVFLAVTFGLTLYGL